MALARPGALSGKGRAQGPGEDTSLLAAHLLISSITHGGAERSGSAEEEDPLSSAEDRVSAEGEEPGPESKPYSYRPSASDRTEVQRPSLGMPHGDRC